MISPSFLVFDCAFLPNHANHLTLATRYHVLACWPVCANYQRKSAIENVWFCALPFFYPAIVIECMPNCKFFCIVYRSKFQTHLCLRAPGVHVELITLDCIILTPRMQAIVGSVCMYIVLLYFMDPFTLA